MAVQDVSLDFAKEMKTQNLHNLDTDKLIAFRIFGVDSKFIQAIRAEGLNVTDSDKLIAFRIHGVSLEMIRALRSSGHQPDEDKLIAMRISRRNSGMDRANEKRRLRPRGARQTNRVSHSRRFAGVHREDQNAWLLASGTGSTYRHAHSRRDAGIHFGPEIARHERSHDRSNSSACAFTALTERTAQYNKNGNAESGESRGLIPRCTRPRPLFYSYRA